MATQNEARPFGAAALGDWRFPGGNDTLSGCLVRSDPLWPSQWNCQFGSGFARAALSRAMHWAAIFSSRTSAMVAMCWLTIGSSTSAQSVSARAAARDYKAADK